jgi:hypothetical protein
MLTHLFRPSKAASAFYGRCLIDFVYILYSEEALSLDSPLSIGVNVSSYRSLSLCYLSIKNKGVFVYRNKQGSLVSIWKLERISVSFKQTS